MMVNSIFSFSPHHFLSYKRKIPTFEPHRKCHLATLSIYTGLKFCCLVFRDYLCTHPLIISFSILVLYNCVSQFCLAFCFCSKCFPSFICLYFSYFCVILQFPFALFLSILQCHPTFRLERFS